MKVLVTFKVGEERQWFHTRHCEMAAAEAYLLQTDFLCYINGETDAVRGALYHYLDSDSQQQRELVVRFDDILYVEFIVPESTANGESNSAAVHTSTGPLESVDERMPTGPLSSRISGLSGDQGWVSPLTDETLCPDVNAALNELLLGASSILGDNLTGLYLNGSLALGDFNRDTSDLDVVIVTSGELSGEAFRELQALHANIAVGTSQWAVELEASYIPAHSLRRIGSTSMQHPRVERGSGDLRPAPHDSDWIIQRHTCESTV